MFHVLVLLGAIPSAWAAGLFPRSVQTDVICSSDFKWADNQAQMNPCLVAAYAEGACYSDTWTVPTLQPGNAYDFYPDPCSCSWAVYNLYGACTACQNASLPIPTWASVTTGNCSGHISDSTYFPPNVPLTGNILFPAWATTNPSSWTDGTFNVGQAKAVANENEPDVNPDSPPPKKATPTGAIVGGVIGGVLVLLMGAMAAWMIRRRRVARSVAAGPVRPPNHGRSLSDLSQKSGTSVTFTTTSGFPPGSPIFSTRAHSIFGSARGSIFSTSSHVPSRIGSPPLSPPLSPPAAAVPLPPENVIVPFLVPPSDSPHRPLNRKTSNDTSIAPVRRDESTPGRRLNPPAYTPSEAGSSQTHLPQGSASVAPRQAREYGHRPGRGEKGSQDTIASSRSLGVSYNNHGGDRMASAPAHSRQTSADAISTIEEGSYIPIA